MNIIDIIEKKKNNKAISDQEINFIITNYTQDKIPDYQMSAFLMSVWFNGMNDREMSTLTMSMTKSGQMLDLSSIPGKKVDKHSTGGVGDKTTIALIPMVASVGLPVPKISGRGLGHTGGTIDKLESIKNFKVEQPINKFIKIVRKIKASIISANLNLAPADKKIYALRDVTGTIDSIPLIASSIMSKKIAGGADAFVLDVTTGSGAFLKNYKDAVLLAKKMVGIGHHFDKTTYAIITDMDQPLGFAVGNALEVKEAIDLLNDQGPEDLKKICMFLGSYMLLAGGVVKNQKEAYRRLENCLKNGKAFDKFKDLIKTQDGFLDQLDNPRLLPQSNYQERILAAKKGYIKKIDARIVGETSMLLGAGRKKKNDKIDLSVGLILKKKVGDRVDKGETLAVLHFNDSIKFKQAKQKLSTAFNIDNEKPTIKPLILDVVDNKGIMKINQF